MLSNSCTSQGRAHGLDFQWERSPASFIAPFPTSGQGICEKRWILDKHRTSLEAKALWAVVSLALGTTSPLLQTGAFRITQWV